MRRSVGTCCAVIVAAIGAVLIPSPAVAQGCEPIRFTTPVNLGGEGEAYQRTRQWQLTLAYRRLVSSEWFVGTEDKSSLAPGGESPIIRIHTFVADVAYALSERYRLNASIPVSVGSVSRRWDDKAIHEQRATGIGDVSLSGTGWLLAPRSHPNGNVSFGVGVKAPTGSHSINSKFYTATGSIDFPADQTIQPGDGGWAVLLQSQAFQKITEHTFGYAGASYMISPKAHSDARLTPTNPRYWAVPDVYSARLGAAVTVLPDQGLSLSLGGRIDGIPVHDLFGGGDDSTIKRTSYVLFAEPGLSLTRDWGSVTLSVPYRLRVNRIKSLFEQQQPNSVSGGGFAKYVVFLSYAYRL